MPNNGYYHGGFFPIVDYYNLEARPEEACDSMGTVTGSGRFTDYVPCPITAVPAPGYWFRQWNDGDTTNPRTIVVMQDTAFTAYFEQMQPEGINAPDVKAPLFTLTPNPAHNIVTVTVNPQLPILNSQLSTFSFPIPRRHLLRHPPHPRRHLHPAPGNQVN